MWLCLSDGFLSIVVNKDHEKNNSPEFLVRSRVKEHILKYFPRAEIHEDIGTDYKFRAFVHHYQLKNMVLEYIDNMEYTNFKNSVKNETLHDFYMSIWHLGVKYLTKRYLSIYR